MPLMSRLHGREVLASLAKACLAAAFLSGAPRPAPAGSIDDAPVVCLSAKTTIVVAGSARSARRIEEATYAVRRPAQAVEDLRTVGLAKSYELHPVSAEVEIRNARGRRLRKTLDDFEDIPFVSAGGFVSDTRALLCRLPPLENGDTLIVRSETKEDPFLGFSLHIFADFSMPLVSGVYRVEIPGDLAPRFQSWNGAGDPVADADGGRVRWTWTVGPVEVPPDEPLQPPAQEYFPVVSIATQRIAWGPSGTWDDLARTYWDRVSDQMKDAPCDLRGRDIRQSSGELDRMLDLVQNNVRYLSISLGPGGKVPHASSEVCRRGYGDCKDMSILLMSVLENEGTEAGLALILTRPPAGYRVDPLPTLQYFNHAVVCAPGPGGDVWLDATHPYGTAATPRPDIQGSPALVVSGPHPGFRHVRLGTPAENLQSTSLTLTEGAGGGWTARYGFRVVGAPAVGGAFRLQDAAERRKLMQRLVRRTGLVGDGDDVTLTRLDFVSPAFDSVLVTAEFAVADAGGRRGAFPLPWEGDPWPLSVLESRTRVTDVYWPGLVTTSDTLTIHPASPWPAISDSTLWLDGGGLHVELAQRSADGDPVFVRTVRLDQPVFSKEDWTAGRDLRQQFVRWSTRSLARSGGDE